MYTYESLSTSPVRVGKDKLCQHAKGDSAYTRNRVLQIRDRTAENSTVSCVKAAITIYQEGPRNHETHLPDTPNTRTDTYTEILENAENVCIL